MTCSWGTSDVWHEDAAEVVQGRHIVRPQGSSTAASSTCHSHIVSKRYRQMVGSQWVLIIKSHIGLQGSPNFNPNPNRDHIQGGPNPNPNPNPN